MYSVIGKLRHVNIFFSGVYLCVHMLKSRIVEPKVGQGSSTEAY